MLFLSQPQKNCQNLPGNNGLKRVNQRNYDTGKTRKMRS